MDSKNIFGSKLEICSTNPMTGFFRNGCCDTDDRDFGQHTVCVVMTDEFLDFSKKTGNDLSTPRPEWNFPGLKAGDRWCICLARWLHAMEAGQAPEIIPESCHESVLEKVDLKTLIGYAWKKSGAS
jgi:uncharacterized protein